MIYIVLGLVLLGVIAAIAGYFRNKKLEKMLEKGEIEKIPEAQEIEATECCGKYEICERDSLYSAVSEKIEYYDDEDLDKYIGISSDSFPAEVVDEFREVFYTLQEEDVAGWIRSLQLRGIDLPNDMKDEALLIINERRGV